MDQNVGVLPELWAAELLLKFNGHFWLVSLNRSQIKGKFVICWHIRLGFYLFVPPRLQFKQIFESQVLMKSVLNLW